MKISTGSHLTDYTQQGSHFYADHIIEIKVKFSPTRDAATPLLVTRIYSYPITGRLSLDELKAAGYPDAFRMDDCKTWLVTGSRSTLKSVEL
jgi:hypothetical protein